MNDRHHTQDMVGAALDCAVALALGGKFVDGVLIAADGVLPGSALRCSLAGITYDNSGDPYSPSSDPAAFVALIKHFNISISAPDSPVHRNGGNNAGWGDSTVWTATSWTLKTPDGRRRGAWSTRDAMTAAARLIVACCLGEAVILPRLS